jgi:spectinomycin phosphotransferase
VNTAAYRVVAEDNKAYFLKLRSGVFDEMIVVVPQFLKAQGIQAVIVALETRKRRQWGSLDAYKMILYPFIEGKNGYEAPLTDHHWVALGAALKRIHTVQVPPALMRLMQREDYSPRWREMVRIFQAQIENAAFDDPTASKLAAFMKARRGEISHLVERAEQLGLTLQRRPLEFVLCHSDVHAGNLLIHAHDAGAQDGLYIVDWDNPILAPKERDLMFVGASNGSGCPENREEDFFYQGYGHTEIDLTALAYFRYERIVQDIAAFCEQLLLTAEGGEDREQAYQYFTGQFLPDHEVETAYKTDMLHGLDD